MPAQSGQWILPWPPPFVDGVSAWIPASHDGTPHVSTLVASKASNQTSTMSYPVQVLPNFPLQHVTVAASQAENTGKEQVKTKEAEIASLHRSRRAVLSQLARRYHRLRLISTPFAQWHWKVVSKRPKRRNEETQRLCLSLRTWRRRVRRPPRQLAETLARLLSRRMHDAFLQLQQPVLEKRLQLARAAMLKILHYRIMLRMATTWWQQVHLRSALQIWFSETRTDSRRRHLPAPPDQIWVSSDTQEVYKDAPFIIGDGNSQREAFELPRERRNHLPSAMPRSLRAKHAFLEVEDDRPQHLLLRVQQEGFRRWWRVACMDTSAKELLVQRQRAAILVLLRQRVQNAMAFNHMVYSLQSKAFKGLQCDFSDSQDLPEDQRHVRRVVLRKRTERKGLRGTSMGEVLRKGWRRWRYAVAAGLRVTTSSCRPANLTLALCRIATEIAEHQQARQAHIFRTPRRPASQRSPRALPPPPVDLDPTFTDSKIPESTHMIFLQKALAGFATQSAGVASGLDDLSPISLWPSPCGNQQEQKDMLSKAARSLVAVEELWSPPTAALDDSIYPPQQGEKTERWRQMLWEAPGPVSMPPPPQESRAVPERTESYEGLRRRALARRLLKTI